MAKVKVSDDVRRAQQKTAAVLRAQFNCRVALDRIDYKFDVIDPQLELVASNAAKGELPEFIIEES